MLLNVSIQIADIITRPKQQNEILLLHSHALKIKPGSFTILILYLLINTIKLLHFLVYLIRSPWI